MTPIRSLSHQRARDLGRALAHRLVPLSRDPEQLAETASLALLSLLPTWLPPGEEATAIALRQLVRDACFSAYLLAPLAPVPAADADPTSEALRGHLERTFAEVLQPPLLQFSEACREALRERLGQAPPLPAVASVAARAEAPPAPPAAAPPAGIGLLLTGLAALACVALGWLGYHLVAGLRPTTFTNAPPELPPPAPVGAAAGSAGSALQPPPDRPLRDGRTSASDRVAPLAALQCLGGARGETAAPADPSNYGPRQALDGQGRPVPHTPQLIVLHETVVDEAAALNLFRRHNSEDGQQASYHVLIGRDGRRLRVVDDAQRAFGAGDSALGSLSVQLKAGLRPSVNNIALHVSLVSPDDGADGEAQGHSGYTAEQYRSLASQIAQWQARWDIPGSRVVTHQEVDRSGSRRDPRSFDWQALGRDLRQQWLACGLASPLADLRR